MTAIAVSFLTPILVFATLFASGGCTWIGDVEMMSAVILSMAAVAGVVLLVLGVEFKKSLLTGRHVHDGALCGNVRFWDVARGVMGGFLRH